MIKTHFGCPYNSNLDDKPTDWSSLIWFIVLMEIISNTEEYLIHIINIKGRNVSKHHSRNSMSAITRLICAGEAPTQFQPTHG